MFLSIDGVALVTGAGSGIGKACSLAYAAEGASGVVFADLNYEAALKTAEESNSIATNAEYRAVAVAVNVANQQSVQSMVDAAVKEFGRIDYSVNSAGVGVQKPAMMEDADIAEMNRFWSVNVMGTLYCMQAVTKVMKLQSTRTLTSRGQTRDVGRGVILNMGSCNSYMAAPEIVQYTTSKHAVMGMTKNAALDNAKYGIRVNAICPSWVETPMVDAAISGSEKIESLIKSVIPMDRIAKVDEIADTVLFMTSPRSSYVTGVGWIVDGGTTLQMQRA